MTFAIKLPVSSLKKNRLYLLVRDRSSLSLVSVSFDHGLVIRRFNAD